MSTITFNLPRVIRSSNKLVVLLIVVLGVAVTYGFVRMQTDQVIAPPGLRLMEAYWKFFICRCLDFPLPFDY